jgi:hypothetical protein
MRKFACLALLAIAVLALGSCVLPNTGTIHVKNRLSDEKTIDNLYIYPKGTPDIVSDHSSLAYNETYDKIGLAPGTWTVESIVAGYGSIYDDVLVEDGHYEILWVTY